MILLAHIHSDAKKERGNEALIDKHLSLKLGQKIFF